MSFCQEFKVYPAVSELMGSSLMQSSCNSLITNTQKYRQCTSAWVMTFKLLTKTGQSIFKLDHNFKLKFVWAHFWLKYVRKIILWICKVTVCCCFPIIYSFILVNNHSIDPCVFILFVQYFVPMFLNARKMCELVHIYIPYLIKITYNYSFLANGSYLNHVTA